MAKDASERAWDDMQRGASHDGIPDDTGGMPGLGFVDEDGEPPIIPAATTPKLQSLLSRVGDEQTMRNLGNELHDSGRDQDIRRLRELRSDDTDHTWLDNLHPAKGPVLSHEDFAMLQK